MLHAKFGVVRQRVAGEGRNPLNKILKNHCVEFVKNHICFDFQILLNEKSK